MKNLAKKCEKIYEKDGLCGVIDYCNSIDHQEWGYCDQCDSENNPILENYCLACGSRVNRGFDNNGEYV